MTSAQQTATGRDVTIGDTLARKGFSTYVGPHAVCSSACGLIWLGVHVHRKQKEAGLWGTPPAGPHLRRQSQ